jgi:hypothetical protein
MNKDVASETTFKFLYAQLRVNRIRPNPQIQVARNTVISKGGKVKYNITTVELKSFTFSNGSQSLSIDNAVLGEIPKRLLFTMVKNKDFLGTMDTNPYFFRHFDLRHFALYVNGKQIPSGGLSLDTSHNKTTLMAYRTLFEGSGIHHSNTGLQITPDTYINVSFVLLFDLTPDRAASDSHTSNPDNGNIRIELKFAKALPDAITCILYLEYDGSIFIDDSRTVTIDY